MKVKSLSHAGKRPQRGTGRATLTSFSELQRRYEHATAALPPHFLTIDAWVAEHHSALWQQIRQEDDELFRLRRLGVSQGRYQERLDDFHALCDYVERLYCEAQPEELGLPPLRDGERVAVYFRTADGSLQRAGNINE